MVVDESIYRDVLRLVVWYPIRWVIRLLPVRCGIAVLRIMGDLHHCLSFGKKRMIRRNLGVLGQYKTVTGSGENERAVREYFRNHYIDRLLILIFPKFGVKEAKRFVAFQGLEHLNEALSFQRGIILVHGHFGPVHLPLVALARLGYRMKQIGLPSEEGLSWVGRNVAFRLRMKYESIIPAEIIRADSFLREAFRWLKDGGIIMTTGDGSGTKKKLGKHSVFELFGHSVMFPLGPAILSQKTGAAIIPMFITPGGNGWLYKVIIEKPLVSDQAGKEAVLDITGQFVKRLESYISKYPGYMHFLDRFSLGELIIDNREIHVA